jgi:hypothetical protein
VQKRCEHWPLFILFFYFITKDWGWILSFHYLNITKSVYISGMLQQEIGHKEVQGGEI